jgi:hypothetical protein
MMCVSIVQYVLAQPRACRASKPELLQARPGGVIPSMLPNSAPGVQRLSPG